jgi:hypothetical protein
LDAPNLTQLDAPKVTQLLNGLQANKDAIVPLT